MQPTEVLTREHRVIEQVLGCLLKLADHAERDKRLDDEAARQAIDFLRGYADAWHHGKEEERLFPMMEARGIDPGAGPTGVMRAEHKLGRRHIGEMERSIDGAAGGQTADLQRFVDNARAYVVLLRQHIDKEDHCLFPIADRVLSDDDRRELGRQFDQAEREGGGSATTRRFLAIAESLAQRLGSS